MSYLVINLFNRFLEGKPQQSTRIIKPNDNTIL